MLTNLASLGRLSSGQQQREASDLASALAEQSFNAFTEDFDSRAKQRVKNANATWFKGFREGLKRKVSLVELEGCQKWTYKISIGKGVTSYVCKKEYDDPVKAIEAGNRKIVSQYKEKFEDEV